MVVLGVEERAGRGDLCRDRPEPGLGQGGLVGRPTGLRGPLLLRRGGERRAAVLRAHVVALAHALGRVVGLPEGLQQARVGQHRGVEHHLDGLGVAGTGGAHLLVRGVRRVPALVADGRGVDPGQLPEHPLGAPEAAQRDVRDLEPLRPRALERGAEDGVGGRDGERTGRSPGQRLLGRDHVALAAAEQHGDLHWCRHLGQPRPTGVCSRAHEPAWGASCSVGDRSSN